MMRIDPRLEPGRIRRGVYASDPGDLFGAFYMKAPSKATLTIMAAPGDPVAAGWEHVSVSIKWRCPTWDEMTFVKSLFWEDSDCVVQFHPPKSDYVNNFPYCLHMWRWTGGSFPMPPKVTV